MSDTETSEEDEVSLSGDQEEETEESGEEEAGGSNVRPKVSGKTRLHAKPPKPAARKRKIDLGVKEPRSSRSAAKRVAAPGGGKKKKSPSFFQRGEEEEECLDFSKPSVNYCREKCKLGERYFVNIEECNFSGLRNKNHRFEALVLTRLPIDDDEKKQAFKFNMPASLIVPLRDALTTLLTKSERL